MSQQTQADPEATERGVIAWFVHHRVAPNLLMLVFLLGGFFMSLRIKQEIFPEFDIDTVSTTVVYPGASPEEIEQGIVLAVEEAIREIDGIKQVTSTASEGAATILAELYDERDREKLYQDIKQEIDRVRTFPLDAEEPQVELLESTQQVLELQLYGDTSEWALRELAEQVRDRLLQNPEITRIDFEGARAYEIHAEVPEESLRAFGLSLDQIARRIRETALELPGGSVDTRSGEILLRVNERRDWAREFRRIPVVATPTGTVLTLGDIATVHDGFEDTNRVATYNGLRSIGLVVFRIADQTPISVSDAVREAMPEIAVDLPPGVHYAINRDRSTFYRQRLQLLLKNACIGLVLVLGLLGLFLELKLAFWVTMGIPTSFLGALLFLPGADVSINMVSMFAFIVALGIVVDDAIVAGENIYEYRMRGMPRIEAAIRGARDIATPIGISIITNILAFIPLYTVPGVMGKIWRVIPLVVIMVFLISWVESLLILPAHIAHTRPARHGRITGAIAARQRAFSEMLQRFIVERYQPFLLACMRRRYLTLACGVAALLVVGGYAASGRMGFILFPRVESDVAVVAAALPYGSPLTAAASVRDRLTESASQIIAENGGAELAEGTFALLDENKVEVTVYLTEPEVRPITTFELATLWRERVGQIAGLESLRFESDHGGPGAGAALSVELSHRNVAVLDQASSELAKALGEFSNVSGIDDGFSPGKEQFDFTLEPEGHSLGLTVSELARQVRNAFYGAEALRQQRGRNEVKVLVRRPESERVSEFDVEKLMIRTPAGRNVPLPQVAKVERGRAYTSIQRRDGRRIVTVTADVTPIGDTTRVLNTLRANVLPEIVRRHPGLTYSFEGKQADFRESNEALMTGLLIALCAIYACLVIPFRSYSQPLIVMIAIPFGMVGAIIGHLLMGYSISIISIMGMIALSGVVVNDALVLIDYANRMRAEGHDAFESIRLAGVRRFRPIILTTLTTFGGLAPMIFETSMQARFLIPMAISLGYGILFATIVTLGLVPTLYLIIEDAKRGLGRLLGGSLGAAEPSGLENPFHG
jgi:multidrug efflux pump subunit AcrB